MTPDEYEARRAAGARPTEAERNYEIMRMANREVQAAMERISDREAELFADARDARIETAYAKLQYEQQVSINRGCVKLLQDAQAERDRERELADALGRALDAVSVHVEGSNRDFDMGIAIATALRQWREARSAL